MIEIINCQGYTKTIPETYGYISLGNFRLPKEFMYSGQYSSFLVNCKHGDREFPLIVVQIGLFLRDFLVLADLTNMSESLLVDHEELFEKLKEEIISLSEFSYNTKDYFNEFGS